MLVWVSAFFQYHVKTDRAKIVCGTTNDPREGLWMIKISKISLQQNSLQFEF